ncbi:hypothetical protein KR51_00026270 [Rubidibacter lacunae KORDI 51-2]|uniref:Uncharacterized protein n=1 Tax=Rubidibacter lacunae KORDI 51-2 TaxID=582515 RepID=U5DIT4_9CHRO|nr:hypothetical protein KR51_00026270 [Rubidibacter lacunae KORDI 51-2]
MFSKSCHFLQKFPEYQITNLLQPNHNCLISELLLAAVAEVSSIELNSIRKD